jgi:hypothetical protein
MTNIFTLAQVFGEVEGAWSPKSLPRTSRQVWVRRLGYVYRFTN